MQIMGGIYKGRVLISPKGKQTRPTSGKLREAFFNICQHFIEDASFLDLFAGSGAIGLEALSRGAKNVTFIEQDREALRCIRTNITQLKLQDQTDVLAKDAVKTLSKLKDPFDIVFADPPYETYLKLGEQRLYLSQWVLNLVEEHQLLKPGGSLFIEDTIIIEAKAGALVAKTPRKFGDTYLQQFMKN